MGTEAGNGGKTERKGMKKGEQNNGSEEVARAQGAGPPSSTGLRSLVGVVPPTAPPRRRVHPVAGLGSALDVLQMLVWPSVAGGRASHGMLVFFGEEFFMRNGGVFDRLFTAGVCGLSFG